ncbi:MAG: EAL domain-containing protein [Nitrospirota bacterium]
MSRRTELAPYEEALLKRFRENFSQYVIEASREEGTEDIKRVFLKAISKLFDLEIAFIAEKKGEKLVILYVSAEKKEVENRLKGAIFVIDEILDLALKEELSLIQNDLKDYSQFKGFDSMLSIPIETVGPKCQYLFLCNRRELAIFESLYTTYDANLCKILHFNLFYHPEVPSEEILQSIIKVVEDLYCKTPRDMISEKIRERENEIGNTLCNAKKNIEMFYMPIVFLQNPSNIFGYEMLARNVRESDSKKCPYEIFEKAKKLGISNRLDYICVRKAFDKIEKVFTHPEENPSLQGKFFFINIHQETVGEDKFKELLKEKSSSILPWFVVFEIIDAGSIKDNEKFREGIKELFLYGYHFADDDHKEWEDDERFVKLKPRYIRIGEKFMHKLVSGQKNETIEKLVKGAFDFGGYVVAEYIPKGEWSQNVIKALRESGVAFGQGNMFGEARRTPIALPSKELLPLEEELKKLFEREKEIKEKFYKEMTFLIIDVAGSTKMKEGKEDIDIDYTFTQYHRHVEGITKENNGEVVWSGDGGLCTFQNPDKAVGTAIQIQEGLSDFNKNKERNRLEKPIMVRIGINTGVCLVDESREKGKWVSEVMDIAGHLQKYSEPGEIRIGEETYKKLMNKTNFKESKSIDGVKTYLYQG